MAFGRKIAVCFAVCLSLFLVVAGVAFETTDQLVATSASVAHTHTVLERIVGAYSLLKDAETGGRGYVITDNDNYLDPYRSATASLPGDLKNLRELIAGNTDQERWLNQAEPLIATRLDELSGIVDARRKGSFEQASHMVVDGEGHKTMVSLRRILDKMDADQREQLRHQADEVDRAANAARWTIAIGLILGLALVSLLGLLLSRTLAGQIGGAVHRIESSSAELQATAREQVAGSRDSALSMNEIAATIGELLATSRQIVESAQRVSEVARQTASAAEVGEHTVEQANVSVQGIRAQMERVVDHMLELGKKSHQIGAILDLVSELAGQTNILAINATIEAAGAEDQFVGSSEGRASALRSRGEDRFVGSSEGRASALRSRGEQAQRFGSVAEEIRDLAARVSVSTKEIRDLIEDVREAIQTTVLATEAGSTTVEAGNRQFSDVLAVFKQIAGLVSVTTEASREIELSTKQQTTAVEQVNVAVSTVAQAAQETEASSSQTLLTASQLADLSRGLSRIVQP